MIAPGLAPAHATCLMSPLTTCTEPLSWPSPHLPRKLVTGQQAIDSFWCIAILITNWFVQPQIIMGSSCIISWRHSMVFCGMWPIFLNKSIEIVVTMFSFSDDWWEPGTGDRGGLSGWAVIRAGKTNMLWPGWGDSRLRPGIVHLLALTSHH